MSRIRVIPVLLLSQQGIVKTKRFARPEYLGDPINAVRIFNDKRVDELVLLDIDATARGSIQLDWISDIVSEAFMPVAYGGGIRAVDDCAALFARGVEKVIVNTAAFETSDLLSGASARFGAQAIVASIDTKREFLRRTGVYVRGGTKRLSLSPVEAARFAEERGAGELVVTSIDREGTYGGYDLDTLRDVSHAVTIPVVANGGAGTLSHFGEAVDAGCSAVAAGSMFVFAARNQGVLISYPDASDLETQLWSRAG